LPALAESGLIRPLPESLFAREHPYQWDGLFPMYSHTLSSWGKRVYGIPLLGEGRVMVYRPERLAEATLAVPETWEDYVAAAKALSKKGAPSLPPLPKRADDLDREFHLIAACYDRSALLQSASEASTDPTRRVDEIFSYQYRTATAEPRINAAAFAHALQLLRDMRDCRPAEQADHPAQAFRSGAASLCIASLEDLARFQEADSPVRGRFRTALIPGSHFTFDLAKGERQKLKSSGVNRMPYLGADGWMGVVYKKCSDADFDAAVAFLTDFAHPEDYGAEIMTAAKWGAGPFRASQLEERNRKLWFGYNMPRDQTERLIEALKANVNPAITNHRFRLRLPNQAEHLKAFDELVRPALLSKSGDTESSREIMDKVNERWKSLWNGVPESRRREWVYQNYGLAIK
jgi:ABC-type glycerol-3-phosphate transport system substrate-binding protein